MAEEVNQTEGLENSQAEEVKEVWDSLFRPEYLESFWTPYEFAKTIKIEIFTSPNTPASSIITLQSYYPFATIDDLKLAIYAHFKKDTIYAPEYQFLSVPFRNFIPGQQAEYYDAVDFQFHNQNNINIYLVNPFKTAQATDLDSRFVDSAGNRKLLQFISRGRALFEDVFLKQELLKKQQDRKPPTLHLYLYRDIVNTIQRPKPLSQVEHNGRLLSFFPDTTPEMDGIILPADRLKRLQEKFNYYEAKQKITTQCLTPILNEFNDNPLDLKMKVKDVKYLRFIWLQQQPNTLLDKLFYELQVNENRPFLRYFPPDTTAMSKIHVKGAIPIPDLPDPCVVLQWAKETSPTSERDFLMGKIRIQQVFGGTTPIYATLQAISDGTGAVVIQPAKPAKRLDPYTDLYSMKENIKEGIKGLPFERNMVDIGEANLVAMIRIPQDLPKPSAKQIRQRLDSFRGFFQEIPPLEGESPLISLRYKAVSNFFRESRVAAYLTQIESRKLFDASSMKQEMIQLLKEEFVISDSEAERQFNEWKEDKQKYVQVQATYDVYKLKDNPGIDILIYAQQSDYFFHFYRMDSYVNLQRIITLLCMMLTTPEDTLCRPVESQRLETTSTSAIPLAGQGGNVPAPLANVAGGIETTVDGGDEGDAGDINEADYFDEMAEEEPAQMTQALVATQLQQAQAVVQAPIPKPVVGEEGQRKLVTAHYFVSKLMEADSTLFNFTPPAGEKKYVSLCAANETRQPAVLDQGGYERMVNEYREDVDNKEIEIIVYSKDKAFPVKPKKKTDLYPSEIRDKYNTEEEVQDHTFTVLKYGTEVNNEKYYLCCEYFCLRDQMAIRKDEFENKVKNEDGTLKPGYFRENALAELRGRVKEPKHCPLCNGTELTEFPKSLPGQTVFRRKLKPKSDKRLTYIGFYTKDKHPLHFGLPCCFNTVQESTPLTTNFFRKLTDLYARLPKAQAPPLLTEQSQEEQVQAPAQAQATTTEADDVGDQTEPPNYDDRLKRVKDAYILDEAKMPLDTGSKPQIGLLPAVLNEYFSQNPETIVSRIGIKQTLESKANAFLRIGVDNRSGKRTESFLAALAPFLRKDTTSEVKALLKDKITPRVFVAANYGNLMLEFADPSSSNFPSTKPNLVSKNPRALVKELNTFAQKLNVRKKDQYDSLRRIYLSYLTFIGDPLTPGHVGFIDDSTKFKEYRHFANVLAQPGVVTDRGLVFIVLEILPNGGLKVNCPPFGYTDAMKNMDIGFLLHQNDIWEPIFYTGLVTSPESSELARWSTLRFTRNRENADILDRGWPEIVKRRVNEFMTNCRGPLHAPYVGIQQLRKGSKLISATVASKIFSEPVVGLVRDNYNHVVCALFETHEEKPSFISLPVVDDGLINPDLELFLGWDGFSAASVKDILTFYRNNASRLALFKGYMPVYYIVPKLFKGQENTKNIVKALQLENGIFIPVNILDSEQAEQLGLKPPPGGQPDELEWEINKNIMAEKKLTIEQIQSLPEPRRKLELEQKEIFERAENDIELEEIYEHFRLSFSNWLAKSEREDGAGPIFRELIKEIIFPNIEALGMDLPVYEKRKRLEILLGPIVLKWLSNQDKSEQGKKMASLLRVDCRDFKQNDTCNNAGRCVWIREGEGEEGKCRIHIPKNTTSEPDIPTLFFYRLIEELIRFPKRRDELLKRDKKHVSSLMAIRSGLRLGSTYIIPEDSIDWVDFLRMDCDVRYRAQAKYLEEFSKQPKLVEKQTVVLETTNAANTGETKSEPLINFLGRDDPKTENLTLLTWDRRNVPIGKNIEAIAGALKISLEDIDYTPSADKIGFSNDEIKNLYTLLKTNILQINLNAAEESQIKGIQNLANKLFYIFVIEGNTIQILQQKGKMIEPISENDLPKLLRDRMKTNNIKKVMKVLKK